jgi:bacterioferritin
MDRLDGTGILSQENKQKREELIGLLTTAYWMEIETVMSYMANSINPDGVRAQEIIESLKEDVQEELGHAERFGNRIKELYGVVPGSMDFAPEQKYLQPPESQTDIVTQDMVVDILRDEEGHRRLFEGFLREFEAEGLA